MYLRRPALLLPAAAALLALSCGGGNATPASPAVVATASPVVTASPLPGPGQASGSCPIGPGDPTAGCSKLPPRLTAEVEAAIDRLVRERPSLFNPNDEQGAGTGQYRVLDTERYVDGLIANLQAAGLCAERTLDRERVLVKSSNDFSEEWDVLSAQGFIRRGSYSYQQSCSPASFPVAAEDLLSFVWVGFFSLECNPGTPTPGIGEKVLPIACDGYVTATPKLKSGRDVPSWIHGRDVVWHVREGADLVSVDPDWRFGNEFNRVLRPKGGVGIFSVCATVLGKQGCLNARTIP